MTGTTAVRGLLVAVGAAIGTYGAWLLRPLLGPALPWLVAGPLLHDLVVAPLVGLVGLGLGRLPIGRTRRAWLVAGLVTTATLLLIAVPLLWRPAPAPPNPGLQDRDYPRELAIWLAAGWGGLALGYAWRLWKAGRGPSHRPSTGRAPF